MGNVAENVDFTGFSALKMASKRTDICLPCFDSYGQWYEKRKNFRNEIFTDSHRTQIYVIES